MIYLDHNATTTVPPRVSAAMAEALGRTGNPSSIHAAGRAARGLLDSAREAVAALFGGVGPDELVFTSGGTEADTIAILGSLPGNPAPGPPRVLLSAIEHPAVLAACGRLAGEGCELVRIPPREDGVVSPRDLENACGGGAALLALMSANNETGARQPVAEAGAICRRLGIHLHVDAVQSAGKERLDARVWGCRSAAISGHKFGGPQGVGALYVRGHDPGASAHSGTPNLPGIAGLGEAARMVLERLDEDIQRLRTLRDRLTAGLRERVQGVSFYTPLGERGLPNTLSVRFEGVGNQTLLMALDLAGVCVSAGPACKSGAIEPSHVLLAMGLTKQQALETLRFSVGRTNTEAEIDRAVTLTTVAVARIRGARYEC